VVIQEALRVGRRVIIGFPNFAYFLSRVQIFFNGRTPVNKALPYEWYETPNLHFFSISDFIGYCRSRQITIEHQAFLGVKSQIVAWPNLLAQTGIFVISAR
jgi:methionine biosynthesis protein MetW